MDILSAFTSRGLSLNRMICSSKEMYRHYNPNNFVIFNASVVTKKDGKIWEGDLDITKDKGKLKEIAEEIGRTLYVLKYYDSDFSIEDLIELSSWTT